MRFIVSGTGVNEQMLIEDIAYGEKDGTGDVYATITMRGYREVGAAQTTAVLGAVTRNAGSGSIGLTNPYFAVYGDTLCSICRRAYGDGSYTLAKKLAAFNFGTRDANILYVGDKVNLPPKEALT